jgi:peptidoglycan/xylan/chitin deacetylase (PgdA/CDA1 family)
MAALHQRTAARPGQISAALATAIVALACVVAPALARAADACWAPERLTARAGEEEIAKAVARAFVAPPSVRLPAATPTPPALRGAIRRVKLPPGKRLVALTFDLCEQPHEVAGYQGGIIDYLRANRVRSTLFVGGKWLLTHRERAEQLISDPLLEIGNHTWEHRNLRLLAGTSLRDEIAATHSAYEVTRRNLAARACLLPDQRPSSDASIPRRMELFRFPFGACNAAALDEVAAQGMLAIQWDVSSGDPWPGQKADRMVRSVLAAVQPGSIVLFHANGRGWHTPSALPAIVKGLRDKGFELVTVGELLRAGEPVITPTCYDSRPGDTDRYDALARRLESLYAKTRAQVRAPAATSPTEAGLGSLPVPPAPVPAQRRSADPSAASGAGAWPTVVRPERN